MQTIEDHLNQYLFWTVDSSDKNREMGLLRLSQIHKGLCASKNYWWLEDEYSFNSEANIDSYFLPVNFKSIKALRIEIAGRTHFPQEIRDKDLFNQRKNLDTNLSDYPMYYYIGVNRVFFSSKFTSVNAVIYIDYIKKASDLKQLNYNSGTISISLGSTSVTGANTAWLDEGIKKGSTIIINDREYFISSVNGNTNLTLSQKYQGETATNLDYIIGDVLLIPEPFQDLVWIRASKEYHSKSGETERYNLLIEMDKNVSADLMSYSSSKSTSVVIPMNNRRAVNIFDRNAGLA